MISTNCSSSDRSEFLAAWLKNPLKIASIVPSGRPLAQSITSEIDRRVGGVIELGPGTGVFTDALLERGVVESDLVLVEEDASFTRMLKQRYPTANIVNINASKIGGQALGNRTFRVTVSGLPLLSMTPRAVLAILLSTFRLMGSNGRFYQFTYGPLCPIPRRILDRLGLKAVRIGWTPLNMPPAAVYRITKRTLLA
jgi:phosphatidylethanolamine/phosphatidyl-N-methylethanolamine N-methyltransferase